MNAVEAYIRQSAIARGIDPDIAVRVASYEGGLDNPIQQSKVFNHGIRETSFGPFQLLIGGGLGDAALRAGIDPRKASDWRAGVDFALNQVVQGGWGPWHGATAHGITGKMGVGPNATTRGISLTSLPEDASGPSSASPYYIPDIVRNPGTGTTAPPVPVSYDSIAPAGVPTPVPRPGTPTPGGPTPGGPNISGLLQGLGGLAGAFGGGGSSDPSASQITPSSIGAEVGSGAIATQAAALMKQIMERHRKRLGTTLTENSIGI